MDEKYFTFKVIIKGLNTILVVLEEDNINLTKMRAYWPWASKLQVGITTVCDAGPTSNQRPVLLAYTIHRPNAVSMLCSRGWPIIKTILGQHLLRLLD